VLYNMLPMSFLDPTAIWMKNSQTYKVIEKVKHLILNESWRWSSNVTFTEVILSNNLFLLLFKFFSKFFSTQFNDFDFITFNTPMIFLYLKIHIVKHLKLVLFKKNLKCWYMLMNKDFLVLEFFFLFHFIFNFQLLLFLMIAMKFFNRMITGGTNFCMYLLSQEIFWQSWQIFPK